MSIFTDLANDKTTPEWSRQLAKAVNSPFFTERADGGKLLARFVKIATQYATLDQAPPNVTKVYLRAMASRGQQ